MPRGSAAPLPGEMDEDFRVHPHTTNVKSEDGGRTIRITETGVGNPERLDHTADGLRADGPWDGGEDDDN